MDEELRELRRISSVLLLAFSDAIEQRITVVKAHGPSAVLIDLLGAGEMKTDRLEAEAKARGVARSTMFKTIGELERQGVVERARRGAIALTDVAQAFAATAALGAQSERRASRK